MQQEEGTRSGHIHQTLYSTHHEQQPRPQGADVRGVRGESVSGLVQDGGEAEAGGVVQQLRGGQVQPGHHRLQHQPRGGGGGVVRAAGKIEINNKDIKLLICLNDE